jgi:ketosteroid isomerase-like protein
MHRVRRSRHIRESCPGDEASHIFLAIMLRGFYEELFSQSDFEGGLDPNNQELHVFGDWAVFRSVLVGFATPPGGGEATPIANKLVNLLHREPDGTWKHVWDIWNPSPANASPR